MVGISDHFESLADAAAGLPFDYFIYHCFDRDNDYRGLERLLASGWPVIVAHPHMLSTRLERLLFAPSAW